MFGIKSLKERISNLEQQAYKKLKFYQQYTQEVEDLRNSVKTEIDLKGIHSISRECLGSLEELTVVIFRQTGSYNETIRYACSRQQHNELCDRLHLMNNPVTEKGLVSETKPAELVTPIQKPIVVLSDPVPVEVKKVNKPKNVGFGTESFSN